MVLTDVSDDVTTPKAIRCANDKISGVLILLSQHVTRKKMICKENLV